MKTPLLTMQSISTVNAAIENMKIQLVLDTGSGANVINARLQQQLNCQLKPTLTLLKLANGTLLVPEGEITARIIVGKIDETIDFLVLKEFIYDVLVGQEFIKRFHLMRLGESLEEPKEEDSESDDEGELDKKEPANSNPTDQHNNSQHEEKKDAHKKQDNNYQVMQDKATSLQSKSSTILKFNTTAKDGNYFFFPSCITKFYPTLVFVNNTADVENAKFNLRITNTGSEIIELSPHTNMGTLIPLSESNNTAKLLSKFMPHLNTLHVYQWNESHNNEKERIIHDDMEDTSKERINQMRTKQYVQEFMEQMSDDEEQQDGHNDRFDINEKLDDDEKIAIESLLNRYPDAFSWKSTELGETNLGIHHIDTGDNPPIKSYPFRASPSEQKILKEEIETLVKAGVLKPTDSSWSFPVLLVAKKPDMPGGKPKHRMVFDARKLNKITKKVNFPIPTIQSCLDRLCNSQRYSSLDFRSAYHQIPLAEEDKEKCTIITEFGTYSYQYMPFGLCNATQTCQRIMFKALYPYHFDFVIIYVDDALICSKDKDDHLGKLEIVLQCLIKAGLKLNVGKCHFGYTKLRFLGFLITTNEITIDPEKLAAINNFPVPKNAKKVSEFIGLCSFFRRLVKNFANLAYPVARLQNEKNPFVWTEKCQETFDRLKEEMKQASVTHYDPEAELELRCDACSVSIAGMLYQKEKNGKNWKLLYCVSRVLRGAETRYSTTEKEALAVVWSVEKLRVYLAQRPFTIVTDHHAICYIMEIKNPTSRLIRWAMRLMAYEFTVKYKSGAVHKDVDALSRNVVSDSSENWKVIEPLNMLEHVDMIEEQSKDAFCKKITKLLKTATANSKIKKDYLIKDDILFRNNNLPIGNRELLVLPRHLIRDILFSHHDDVTIAHLGIRKCYDRVRRRYYWQKMFEDVYKYISGCINCQMRKNPKILPPGRLNPLFDAVPMRTISIDHLGPFKISTNKMRHVLVIIDMATRWMELKAVPSTKAIHVAKMLVEVAMRFGCPQNLQSDRGTSFMSEVTQEMLRIFQTRHVRTTAYRPSCNGLSERRMQVISDMISHYVSSDHRDWHLNLHFFAHAYNVSINVSTGFSPFYLMYLREPDLPSDQVVGLRNDSIAFRTIEKYMNTRDIVRENMDAVHLKEIIRYDGKHSDMTYYPGDLVMIHRPFRRIGETDKLLYKNWGPYVVKRRTSLVNYEVRLPDEDYSFIVHIVYMKKFEDNTVLDNTREDDYVLDNNVSDNEVLDNLVSTEAVLDQPIVMDGRFSGQDLHSQSHEGKVLDPIITKHRKKNNKDANKDANEDAKDANEDANETRNNDATYETLNGNYSEADEPNSNTAAEQQINETNVEKVKRRMKRKGLLSKLKGELKDKKEIIQYSRFGRKLRKPDRFGFK